MKDVEEQLKASGHALFTDGGAEMPGGLPNAGVEDMAGDGRELSQEELGMLNDPTARFWTLPEWSAEDEERMRQLPEPLWPLARKYGWTIYALASQVFVAKQAQQTLLKRVRGNRELMEAVSKYEMALREFCLNYLEVALFDAKTFFQLVGAINLACMELELERAPKILVLAHPTKQ
jgi:hypothetical protein